MSLLSNIYMYAAYKMCIHCHCNAPATLTCKGILLMIPRPVLLCECTIVSCVLSTRLVHILNVHVHVHVLALCTRACTE